MAKTPLIAVTGATGFFGSHVLPCLLERGYQVKALVRTPQKLSHLKHDNLSLYQGDMSGDLTEFVVGADMVLHMAGVIKARRREDYFAVNTEATAHLAMAAEDVGVKRFVLLSSLAAREPGLSHYAASKAGGEEAVKLIYTGKTAIIRAPAIIGPGDQATRPFFEAAQRGILPVPGGAGWRERRFALAYAPDLARDVVEQGLKGAYDGKTVSPANLPDLSWDELADLCEQALEKTVRPVPLPLPLLYAYAGLTSLTSYVFGKGHFTLGKLREFLYESLESEEGIKTATPVIEALRTTLLSYTTDSHE